MENAEHSKWLIQSVQVKDRDRYLCAMFLPKEKRQAAFAVLDFHADATRIRENTTEPLIAAMRFQAMRDWIEGAGDNGTSGGNPVIEILSALDNWSELKPWLLQILDVRQQDLDLSPFTGVADAEEWVRRVTAPLAQALLCVCASGAVAHGNDVPESLSSVLAAHGLIGLLRSVPYAAENGFKIWQIDYSDENAMRLLAKATADHAHGLVLVARERQTDMPRAAFPLLLHGALALQQVRALHKLDYAVFDERFCGPSKLGAAILVAALRKKI